MSCLRAFEDGRTKTVLSRCKAYPKLTDWININNLYKDKVGTIEKLRTHAIDLAREQIQNEISRSTALALIPLRTKNEQKIAFC